MAYVVGRGTGQQDDEQEQAPLLSGGGTSAQPTSAPVTTGTARPAPSASPAPLGQNAGRSGRFTNIQTILGQNTGIAKQVGDTSSKAIGAAKSAFDASANPLRGANFSGNTDWRGLYNGAVQQGARPEAQKSSFEGLRGLLNQDYNGPGKMEFNAGADSNLQKNALLGDARTAGGAIAEGRYNAGARRFDQGLFQADTASQGAMRDTGAKAKEFTDAADTEVGTLNAKVDQFKGDATAARDKVRNELTAEGQALLGGVQARADAANAAEQAAIANKNQYRDPVTGEVKMLADNQAMGDWVPGSGPANVGNTVNADEVSRFSLLRNLLQDAAPDVQDTGDFKAGGYSAPITVRDAGPSGVDGSQPINSGAMANQQRGWTPENQAQQTKFVKSGIDPTIAAEAVNYMRTGLSEQEAIKRASAEFAERRAAQERKKTPVGGQPGQVATRKPS